MTSNAILEIDLTIIRNNYIKLKQQTSAEVSAVIKADAYGLGATPIYEALVDVGCKKFFVAYISEALELRRLRQDKSTEIFVLSGPSRSDIDLFHENFITPVINDLYQAELLNQYCMEKNISKEVILHVETGMNRLAMPLNQIQKFISEDKYSSNLVIKYVMSHLVSSEERDNEINYIQLENFRSILAQFKDVRGSLSNSFGIFLGKDYHFDLIRPGAALFGLNCKSHMSFFGNPLRLFSRLIQVKKVQKGESLGYNHTYLIDRDHIVGTIPVGYADGILRQLSNNGSLFIDEIEVPIIGRVSMDLINLDLTNVPIEKVNIGAEVDIIGKMQTPENLAEKAGTIGYEVLTSLGNRYERKYRR